MAKRSEIINRDTLDGLLLNHPYLLIFQKDDWKEYLEIIALIYDYLEEANAPVPFEVIKTILFRHYADRVVSVDTKIAQFFTMMIVELQVLKDTHDPLGKRYIESTAFGKELLKLMESMLEKRTRFSGTNAETMLGALNSLLFSPENISLEEAIRHHREKIRAYQLDLEKLTTLGPRASNLLPLMHSSDALFGQAEEAAIHVLAATEDVKVAIERERKTLAERYLRQEKSAGESVRLLIDFHLELHRTEEYKSYKQAKELFSRLNQHLRFKYTDVAELLATIKEKKIVPEDLLKKSHLSSFTHFFEAADASIREKIRVQIEILRQQVAHALMTDSHLVQDSLNRIFKTLYEHKNEAHSFLNSLDLNLHYPWSPDFGEVELNPFHLSLELEGMSLLEEKWSLEDLKSMGEGLARAEENTLQKLLEQFKKKLKSEGAVQISRYGALRGFAEFYVLMEADILDPDILKECVGSCEMNLNFSDKNFILKNVPDYVYTLKDSHELRN